MNLAPIDYSDDEPIEVPVKTRGGDYVLREASGDAAVKYRNKIMECTKVVDGKYAGAAGLADAEPLLVSLCLFKVVTKEGQPDGFRPVKYDEVRALPARLQKELFNRVKEISELNETEDTLEALVAQRDELDKKIIALQEEQDAPKNEQGDTMDGSGSRATTVSQLP